MPIASGPVTGLIRKESGSLLCVHSLQVLAHLNKISLPLPEPSQSSEHPQLSLTLLKGAVFQSFITSSVFVRLSPVCPCLLSLGRPELDQHPGLVSPELSQGAGSLLSLTISTAPHAAQHAFGGVICHKGRLLVHGQLGVCWDPQGFL